MSDATQHRCEETGEDDELSAIRFRNEIEATGPLSVGCSDCNRRVGWWYENNKDRSEKGL